MASTASKKKNILFEPFCIFCRKSTTSKRQTDRVFEAWEEEIFCFFEIVEPGGELKSIRYLVRLDNYQGLAWAHLNMDKQVQAELSQAGFQIVGFPWSSDQDLEHTANCVHIPCLRYAVRRLPRLSVQSLCRVALTLRPVTAWENTPHLTSRYEPPLSAFPYLDSVETGLGALLKPIRERFPVEIQKMILQYVDAGLFSSLAHTSETLDSIQRFTKKPLLVETQVSLPSEKVITIGSNTIHILGENCLSGLQMNPEEYDCEIVIDVSEIKVKGIQFALGLYGVTGLRVHYMDGSTSPWLCKNSPKWIKFVQGTDLSSIWMLSDGFKILSLSFNPTTQNVHTDKELIIWDHHRLISEQNRCYMIGGRYPQSPSIRGNPTSRYRKYLPFPFNDGRMHSLTVFVAREAATCIQIDGDPRQRLGNPGEKSCPVTYYLHPNEAIQRFYFVTGSVRVSHAHHGPFLLAKTTRGRFLYYASFMMPRNMDIVGHISEFNVDATMPVAGMFIDPLDTFSQDLTTWGIVFEPGPEKVRQSPTAAVPSVIVPTMNRPHWILWDWHYPQFAMGYSVSFSPCASLQVQRIGQRCIGLQAQIGSSKVTLGQWDPSNIGSIHTLHTKEEGPIEHITFVYSDANKGKRYITDVVINSDAISSETQIVWDDVTRAMTWYFNDKWDEIILAWEGTYSAMDIAENAFKPITVGV